MKRSIIFKMSVMFFFAGGFLGMGIFAFFLEAWDWVMTDSFLGIGSLALALFFKKQLTDRL